MSSVQQTLPRNYSLDSAMFEQSPHPRMLQGPQSPGGTPSTRERASATPTPASTSQASRAAPWPPLIRTRPSAALQPPAAASARPKPLTIAIDAEAIIQIEAGASPFAPHTAMPLMKKLLSINNIARGGTPWIEVVLLCHVTGETRGKLLDALREAEFPVERMFFTRGPSLQGVLKPCDALLYLSCDAGRTRDAVAEGIAAGCILARSPDASPQEETVPHVLQVAFDFDGVLADDASEKRFKAGGLAAFHALEESARDIPMGAGPGRRLAMALAEVRDGLAELRAQGADVPLDLRIGVVTSRGSVAIARLHRTLTAWGLEPDTVYCLAGKDKTPYLQALGSDLFIDDLEAHAARAKNIALSAHMPTLSSLQAA